MTRRRDARSRHHRQRQHQRADRPQRAHRLVLPAVVRRRSRCSARCCRRRIARCAASSTSRSTASQRAAVLRREHRRARHAARGRRRQRDRNHRLRAALQAARPHLPSDESRAHDPPGRGRAAHHAATAPARRLRRARARAHVRFEPSALRARRRRAARDDRRAAADAARRAAVPARPRDAHRARSRRDADRFAGASRARRARRDARLLARMGALSVDPGRMAGRGDPRGDHAEALPVRRHRRDRRRDDDVDSRSAAYGSATGITATAGCATPRSSCAR